MVIFQGAAGMAKGKDSEDALAEAVGGKSRRDFMRDAAKTSTAIHLGIGTIAGAPAASSRICDTLASSTGLESDAIHSTGITVAGYAAGACSAQAGLRKHLNGAQESSAGMSRRSFGRLLSGHVAIGSTAMALSIGSREGINNQKAKALDDEGRPFYERQKEAYERYDADNALKSSSPQTADTPASTRGAKLLKRLNRDLEEAHSDHEKQVRRIEKTALMQHKAASGLFGYGVGVTIGSVSIPGLVAAAVDKEASFAERVQASEGNEHSGQRHVPGKG